MIAEATPAPQLAALSELAVQPSKTIICRKTNLLLMGCLANALLFPMD